MVKSIVNEKPNICNQGFGTYKTFNVARQIENAEDGTEQFECWSHTVKDPKLSDVAPVFIEKEIELTEEEKTTFKENTESVTRDELITAIIRARYSADDVEAIICNQNDGNEIHTSEYNALQAWRQSAKEKATEFMEVVDETLEEAINKVVTLINQYNNSSAVNTFMYNNVALWVDKETRNTFMTSILSAEQRGDETITAPFLGGVEFPIATAKAVLSQLQGYCDQAGIVTYKHIENVKALKTVEEVNAYDYKADYPEILKF